MLLAWLSAISCAAAELPQLAAAGVPQLAACANAEVWEFGTHKTPVAAAGYHLTVWSPASPPPSTPSANATVLLFVTGFGATVSASAYSHAMCAIATGGGNGSNAGAEPAGAGAKQQPGQIGRPAAGVAAAGMQAASMQAAPGAGAPSRGAKPDPAVSHAAATNPERPEWLPGWCVR